MPPYMMPPVGVMMPGMPPLMSPLPGGGGGAMQPRVGMPPPIYGVGAPPAMPQQHPWPPNQQYPPPYRR
jgi:hypothetical protein